jgi:hypothetical protein
MSATTPEQAQQDAIEKAWKVLILQADTLLKLSQAKTEPWKLVVGGVGTGAALFAAAFAFAKLFL